jgi:tRNA uridine 5-carbamoylmethylation protein Kti12
MELNLTAKDKHALKSLSVDLRDMLRMKKVDDMFENPEHSRVFDASFFQITEGNNLDEMLNWIEDFRNRMADAEKEQSRDELYLETKKLTDAGWITQQNENE